MSKTIMKKISLIARTIKVSLAMVIPVLFVGSITVLLNGFPILAYQEFLDSFLGGAFRNIILTIQGTTVGILAIHITVGLNLGYMKQTGDGQRIVSRLGSLLSCLTGFFIISGIFWDRDVSLLSGQGVFSAMLAGIIGSVLFHKFESVFKTRKMNFVDGADSEFNAALQVIRPFASVVLCFAAANYLITVCFGVQSFQHLFMNAMDALFVKMQRSYSSGLLFTSLTSAMWWFGIHGNNVLNQVAIDMFTEIIPGEIVSKSFIDTFVNMGGTGCTIGLLAAMFIFGKRSSTRKLSGMAVLPGIFNIGEMMVFGFPVIYNPVMAIPFILAPVLCFTNAYLLTKAGFVPPVTSEVVWTTPALMSGYIATGSVRGMIVQLLNILISTACYAPAVIISERRTLSEYSSGMDQLVETVKRVEETAEEVTLTESEGNAGRLARLLAADLEASLAACSPDASLNGVESPLFIKYQPQYDSEGQCIGAEALLRWNHIRYGTIYPPLAIQIAKESGDLYRLETYIIERAIRDSESFRSRFGDKFRLNINVTVPTLYDKRFISFLQTVADRYRLRYGNICLEITEETELVTAAKTGEIMSRVRPFGFCFALDNFNMSHTSLYYLQHNRFDMVKLDGGLVRSILDNDRTVEIVNSVIELSGTLDFTVIAENVETSEQKDALGRAGCLLYQGNLFSEAIDADRLTAKV